jgi:spore maturation protein CgeB
VKSADLVWVGNFGDAERSRELEAFLVEPVGALRLTSHVYGVRYPKEALASLARAGIEYGGFLPNHRVPEVFARHRVTVHIPRRPYARALPGIPTIRPFEALACGIPLVSAPWEDTEGLFRPGRDFLVARDGAEMKQKLRAVLEDRALAKSLRDEGRRTVLERHTCAHRAAQLLEIARTIGAYGQAEERTSSAEEM